MQVADRKQTNISNNERKYKFYSVLTDFTSNVYIFSRQNVQIKQYKASQVTQINRTTEKREHMQNSISKNEQGNVHKILRLGMLKVQHRGIFYMAKSFRDRDKTSKLTALK